MPAEIEFHTGLDDKLAFACRLLRKAYRKGTKVAVTADAQLLAALDQSLWTFEPLEFVPHARLTSGATPAPRLQRTPVWLLDPGARAPHHEVLVNLAAEVADGFDAFARVIEVVSTDPADRDAGRRRWRFYESRGLTIKHHNAGA